MADKDKKSGGKSKPQPKPVSDKDMDKVAGGAKPQENPDGKG